MGTGGCPQKVSIIYSRKKPEPEYLKQYGLPKDVPIQISYIDMPDAIVIQENGYYYDQRNWINQGYWSWKNLADLLPYDYTPRAKRHGVFKAFYFFPITFSHR